MGKYMRKAKTTGEVAVMDLSLGVRTRAKTLALQRQAILPQPPPAPAQPPPQPAFGYLQLRSRRLVKPPILVHDSKRQKHGHNKEAQNPNANSMAGSRVRVGSTDSGTNGAGQKKDVNGENKEEDIQEKHNDGEHNNNNDTDINESKDLGIEASFGENVLDIEGRESTRESTPCSLIRDPETIRTPGSTTRPASSTEISRRLQNSTRRHIPTAHEMDEFFAGAEQEQQRQFIEKYNFDPVNDKPLPGRYEWEKLDP
ncbi:cyclin-dependent kinase inhibitor 3 isoform X2 [Hevea brasiliensis]|uniref:cyclin-dependent kinase inhibitor 3 isoform X2 n=1 Tax=Hevea brasiliensis TaxID=3981 RepID=UPI0025E40BE9|nr:cyclin-dependent kinase inhibitor 3 isoform X2 [Hevea brasiliensis]